MQKHHTLLRVVWFHPVHPKELYLSEAWTPVALFAPLAINMKCFISLKKEKKFRDKFLHVKSHAIPLISPKQCKSVEGIIKFFLL